MKILFNILLIVFLLAFVSSCNKLTPLERVSDASKKESNNNSISHLKSGESNTDLIDNDGSITDTDNDEDHDSDVNITDTDNDEDHDKESSDRD